MPLPLAELEDRGPKARRRPALTAALAVACAAGAAAWPSDRLWLLLAAAGMAAYPREPLALDPAPRGLFRSRGVTKVTGGPSVPPVDK